MSEGELFTCTSCSASFRRAEHLRRHLVSHSSSRPFRCHFCEACFKRRDVLRKHHKGCSERIARDFQMPGNLLAGKKATSCDQCARSKKACNCKAPCSTCVARKRSCTYARQWLSSDKSQNAVIPQIAKEVGPNINYGFASEEDLTSGFSLVCDTNVDWDNWDWIDEFSSEPQSNLQNHNQVSIQSFQSHFNFDPVARPKNHTSIEGTTISISHQSFDFLLHFTQSSGVRKIFNYNRHRITQEKFDVSQGAARFLELTSNIPQKHSDEQDSRVTLLSLVEYFDDPLFAQTKVIWDCFRVSRIRRPPHVPLSNNEAEQVDERCLRFFCPPNIRRFLQLFWDEWYPHCPTIHKPTFDALKAPSMLLVPMILMGAFMSPNPQDASLANEWVAFGEEHVFSDPIFSAEAAEKSISENDIAPLKMIQAAYIICILLNWEGNDTTKRRVRHHRLATLVSVVREIGLSSANHFPIDYVEASGFDWLAFIQREEAIRTFTFVFLLDTAFVIFNNSPPKMGIHEMELEMTIPEGCFQKADAEGCYTHWHAYTSQQLIVNPIGPLLLSDAIGILMKDNFSDHSQRFVGRSTLNLFTIVGGLETILFQQRSLSMFLPTAFLPIRNAMTRWHLIWRMRSDTIDEAIKRETWQDIGFSGQAQEFACLLLARLDALDSSQNTGPYLDCRKGFVAPILDGKLDDSSMSLVTNLMLSLTVSE